MSAHDSPPLVRRPVRKLREINEWIAEEVRAELARQRLDQIDVAEELFNQNQQWLSRRVIGDVPFSAGELVLLADYLGVSVEKFTSAPGREPSARPSAGVRRRGAVSEAPATGLEPVTCRGSAPPVRHLSIVPSHDRRSKSRPGSPERTMADAG